MKRATTKGYVWIAGQRQTNGACTRVRQIAIDGLWKRAGMGLGFDFHARVGALTAFPCPTLFEKCIHALLVIDADHPFRCTDSPLVIDRQYHA